MNYGSFEILFRSFLDLLTANSKNLSYQLIRNKTEAESIPTGNLTKK